jgi:hypothetical protein
MGFQQKRLLGKILKHQTREPCFVCCEKYRGAHGNWLQQWSERLGREVPLVQYGQPCCGKYMLIEPRTLSHEVGNPALYRLRLTPGERQITEDWELPLVPLVPLSPPCPPAPHCTPQTLIVWSQLPLTIFCPFGLMATQATAPWWRSKLCNCALVTRCHSRIVSSQLQVRNCLTRALLL